MTTEILQNMLYKQSEKLKIIDYIINFRRHRKRVCLEEIFYYEQYWINNINTTIPNYLDFAKWIGSIKEKTIYIEITYKNGTFRT